MRALIRRYNPHVLLALAIALAYHGALLAAGSYKNTYDAYVHMFFADHYAREWFDHWEPRWYTGFPMTSYPPGAQQAVALLSFAVGLRTGFVMVATLAILNCTLGVYRSAKIWVDDEAAGYAALLLVFSSCVAETIHVFGQLPTIFSLGFLLNALPFVYRWLQHGKVSALLTAWALNAATTAGHHVTTLFGAVFFVAPVVVLALVEAIRTPEPDEPPQRPSRVTRENFWPLVFRRVRRIRWTVFRAATYAPGLVGVLIFVVLPYWIWSKSDPITQVSIPHASRDSFIKNTSAGFVFWVLPYGLTLFTLPYVFYKGLFSRAWPLGLSLSLLFVLGTGGTTPIPRLLLRGAFDILTLDRFTFWAAIIQLPLLGQFVVSVRHGRVARHILEQFGELALRTLQVGLIVAFLLVSVFSVNLARFRRFQPDPIDVQPIVVFLEKDQHWRWRYLTLGFGDQMAWLASQTTANSVDGNYHSARRLPEMTSTPVERLEGAKYSGVPGIGSLQQFVTVPDKYSLKFIFSNDQFYDPLLFFSGWHRLERLENGIMVWERSDIPPLPEVLPRKEIPYYQRVLWSLVPVSAIVLALITFLSPVWWPYALKVFAFAEVARVFRLPDLSKRLRDYTDSARAHSWTTPFVWGKALGQAMDRRLLAWSTLPPERDGPPARWQRWLDWAAKVPRPTPATITAQRLRMGLLGLALSGLSAYAFLHFRTRTRSPGATMEAYFDDLDFRRFATAYERLDPRTRPPYDQYLVELSVKGGMVASYGKLNNVHVRILSSDSERVELIADTDWITSLAEYKTSQQFTLRLLAGRWRIEPESGDISTPPDEFFCFCSVVLVSAGRRRITPETTAFGDILDRPELQLLSARLVRHGGRFSVIGEVLNTDVDPADLTVTAILNDSNEKELARYNAQSCVIHTLLPKEVTPFRVDFEGVAGARLENPHDFTKFKPDAVTPLVLPQPVRSFDVSAAAVVTPNDLNREVGVQRIAVYTTSRGEWRVSGELLNGGSREATIPHLLITYYDGSERVAWVDHYYLRESIRPQRTQAFDLALTSRDSVELILDKGNLFANTQQNSAEFDDNWSERIRLPATTGYASMRISVHYYVASTR